MSTTAFASCSVEFDQRPVDVILGQDQRHFRASSNNRFSAQFISQLFHFTPDRGAGLSGLDAVKQAHEMLSGLTFRNDGVDAGGGECALIKACIQAARRRQQRHLLGRRWQLSGRRDRFGDHPHKRNFHRFDDGILERMGGIAGHDQEIGALCFQSPRHGGKHRRRRWPSFRDCLIAVGHMGIVVHQHPYAVLIGFHRRQPDDARHQIHRRGRTHSAKDADSFGHQRPSHNLSQAVWRR